MSDDTLELARQAGWTIPVETWDSLSDYNRLFMRGEFTAPRTLGYYRSRLEGLGLCGHGRVLDAACGMGQWTVALAGLNAEAWGVDLDPQLIGVARALAGAHGLGNTDFRYAPLERLPYADASFDAAFCYGAFMFTDMARAGAELARVLRPGGRLYVNANTWGWHAHLLLDLGLAARNLHVVRMSLRALGRTLLGRGSQVVVPPRRLRAVLEGAGFRVEALGPEGSLRAPGVGERDVPPAYKGRFYGMTAIVEALAVREARP
jgi:SAM-dependent methyltransferase